ncbi:arylesterase [Pholiota conissans]|uniref:Arylesterase n=1 Tax=Pholiota conissans TaxID=109636 RepID=A0A9P5YVL8_9AGAR|nr:arylesterase [Pholiota conissans]
MALLSRSQFTRLILVLGLIWYRSGALFKNCILYKSSFPTGYIANGDYAKDCNTVRDPEHERHESLNSCEDSTFWELRDAEGRVLERPVIVTCDPGRKAWNTVMGPLRNPEPRGGLWLYVHGAPTTTGRRVATKPRVLAPDVAPNKAHRIVLKDYPEGHDFHPLGVEVWPSYAGNSSNLYVINHARKRTTIEQFVLSPERPLEAEYVRTISTPYFVSPNALALTTPDAFYVSNDHLITRRWPIIGYVLPVIESVFALPLGFVSHVTLTPPGSSGSSISKHNFAKLFVPFPNGISLNALGNRLAVSSSSLAQVLIYKRDPATDALPQLINAVQLPFTPDNIHYTESRISPVEEIIVAGHPNFIDLSKVAANKTGAAAASWVVAIVPKKENGKPETAFDLEAPVSANSKLPTDGARWTLQTLFQSSGVESEGGFGASTTGLRDPETGNFFVPGLYAEGGLMVCKPSN